MVRDYQNDNKKCGSLSSSNRLFKLENEHATEAMCIEDCAKDPKCVAVLGGMNHQFEGKQSNSWCWWCFAECRFKSTQYLASLVSFKKQNPNWL